MSLSSVKTVFDYEEYAFACEFAATDLKYRTGASIDDILCEPSMPEFTEQFRLVRDPLEKLPAVNGVYILYEREKPLYARSTSSVRHGVEQHRRPELLAAIAEKLWQPDPDGLVVSYAVLPAKSPKSVLRPVEKRIVQEKRPIFNIPRTAA